MNSYSIMASHSARIALLLVHVAPARAFYLPGVSPIEYDDREKVEMKVNKLTSTKTQLPYEWYSLPFCKPDEVHHVAENLGEVMRGDRIVNSLYEIKMNVETTCEVLCKMAYTAAEMRQFSGKIAEDYRVNWIIDNLPAATRVVEPATPTTPPRIITIYERGFPLGFRGSAEIPGTTAGVNYVYNHHRLVLKYHMDASFEGSRIVGFEVEPFSVKHEEKGGAASGAAKPLLSTCTPQKPVTHNLPPQPVRAAGDIVWTYDVRWEYSDVKWASRWDVYLYATDEQIHWFSIVNSLMIVLFLSGMVAMIMTRTLHRDLRRYNDVESMEEMQEESGWKLVSHAPPPPPAIHVPCTAVARSSTCGARCRGARARGRSLPAPRMRRSTATSSARRRALGYSRCTSGRGRRSSRAR